MHTKAPISLVVLALAGTVLFQSDRVLGQSGAGDGLGPNISMYGATGYRIGPEDVLDVFVWKEPDITRSVVVRPDGKVSLPLSGEIEAADRTPEELEREITARLETYIANPVVTVIVSQVNSPRISVLGEVHSPNVFRVRDGMTALEAIALAGGFTEFAKKDDVVVIRSSQAGTDRFELDLEETVDDRSGGVFFVQPGDVIYVK